MIVNKSLGVGFRATLTLIDRLSHSFLKASLVVGPIAII